MSAGQGVFSIADFRNRIDWKLLVFLLLLLNVKLVVKLAALLFVYLIHPDFRFQLRFKNSRLPLFYPVVIVIALFNWLLYQGYSSLNYSIVVLFGIAIWVTCFLAMHQVRRFVEELDVQKIHRTLVAFFIINAAFSFGELIRIVIETGAINPYLYQGNYQKYFISTGDYIKGLSFDTSTTNAVISSFGLVYFLFKKQMGMTLLCMAVLLLTGSNLMNFLLVLALVFLFVFRSDRDQKSLIMVCFFMLVVFLAKISPQNNSYVAGTFENFSGTKKTGSPGSTATSTRPTLITHEQQKEQIARQYLDSIRRLMEKQPELVAVTVKPEIPQPNIHTPPYQSRNDTFENRKKLIELIHEKGMVKSFSMTDPGKLTATRQLVNFFRGQPSKILTGNGTGNFSSKLAFRAAGLGYMGTYPKPFIYTHPDFEQNHLAVYSFFFSREAGLHSVVHSPNSVYLQLAGEYGLLGLGALVFLYLGYFLKRYNLLTYGLPLLLLLTGVFMMDYWFEQLSVVVMFELLIFLNLKESAR